MSRRGASRPALIGGLAAVLGSALVWAAVSGGGGGPAGGPRTPGGAPGNPSAPAQCRTGWTATLVGPPIGSVSLAGTYVDVFRGPNGELDGVALYSNQRQAFVHARVFPQGAQWVPESRPVSAGSATINISTPRLPTGQTGTFDLAGRYRGGSVRVRFYDRSYALNFVGEPEYTGQEQIEAEYWNVADPGFGRGSEYENGTLIITRNSAGRISGTIDAVLVSPEQPLHGDALTNQLLAPIVPYRAQLSASFDVYPGNVGTCPFSIASRTPDDGHHNIDFRDPEIEIEFTHPYDPATVTSQSVQVGYLDAASQYRSEAVQFVHRPNGRTVELVLQAPPLRNAVYYRVRVQGGAVGVRSTNGDTLDAPGQWRFGTAVDLNAAGNSHRTHIFQTSKDAKLVRRKPAVVRVYAEWQPDPGVLPSEQVETFRADVSALDGSRQTEAGPIAFRYVRPDLYAKHGVRKRRAEHTANVFGWKPQLADGSPAHGRIVVNSDATGDTLLFEAQRPVTYLSERRTLDFDYYFVMMAGWSVVLPPGDRGSGRMIAKRAERYTTQNFPVASTRGRDGGPLYLGLFTLSQILSTTRNDTVQAMAYVASLVHNAVAPVTSSDMFVAFVDPVLQPSYAATWFDRWAFSSTAANPLNPNFVFPTITIPALTFLAGTSGLSHEFGHALGVQHVPPVADDAARSAECSSGRTKMAGIEGWRMASSGRFGWNKSYDEGNAESGTLLPLVYPCVQLMSQAFVTEQSYQQMLSSTPSLIALGPSGVPPAGALRTPERQPPSTIHFAGFTGAGESASTRLAANSVGRQAGLALQATGLIGPSTDADLIFLQTIPGDRSSAPETGPYTAELIDPGGVVLESTSFDAMRGPDGQLLLSVALPWHDAGVRFVVREGAAVLAERARSSSPPAVRWSNPAPGDEWSEPADIRWRGSDPDGDRLSYTVLYSPDGESDWQVLAAYFDRETLPVDPSDLEAGPDPTLRVVASDGFDQAEATVSFSMTRPLQIDVALPLADEEVDRMLDVEVFFREELDPASVSPDRVRLLDPAGATVRTELIVDPESRTLILTPVEPLEPGTHTAIVEPGITDRFGNRLETGARWSFEVRQDGGTGGLPVGVPPTSGADAARAPAPTALTPRTKPDLPTDPAELVRELIEGAEERGENPMQRLFPDGLPPAEEPPTDEGPAGRTPTPVAPEGPRVHALAIETDGSLERSLSLTWEDGATLAGMCPSGMAGALSFLIEETDGVSRQVAFQMQGPIEAGEVGRFPLASVQFIEMESFTASAIFSGTGELQLQVHRTRADGGPRISGQLRAPRLAGVFGGEIQLTVSFDVEFACG